MIPETNSVGDGAATGLLSLLVEVVESEVAAAAADRDEKTEVDKIASPVQASASEPFTLWYEILVYRLEDPDIGCPSRSFFFGLNLEVANKRRSEV